MNRSQPWPAALLAVLLVFCLFGCAAEESPPPPRKGYLYLGLVLPQKGPLAALGRSLERGARMAVEAANARGGVRGRPVGLLVEDEISGASRPARKRLARDPRVLVLIGHLLENALEAARPVYLRAGRPVLLPVLSADEVAATGKGLFFRLMPSDTAQARALGEYCAGELKARRVLVLKDPSVYGQVLAQAFVQGLGPEVQVEQAVYPAAAQAGQARPEAVFLALSRREAVSAAQALSAAGLKTTLLGVHALAWADTVGFLKRYSARTFLSLPFGPEARTPQAEKFAADFQARYNRTPDWLAALAFDAAGLALAAIEEVGDRPEEIRAYLAGLNRPARAYQGLAGEYYFEAPGRGVGPVFIVRAGPALVSRLP